MGADPEADDFLSLLGSSSSTVAFLIKIFTTIRSAVFT